MYSRKVQSCLGSNLTSFPWLSELNSPYHIISKINWTSSWCYCEKYWSRAIHYTVVQKEKVFFNPGKHLHVGFSKGENIFILDYQWWKISSLRAVTEEKIFHSCLQRKMRRCEREFFWMREECTFQGCHMEIKTEHLGAVTGR